MDKLPQVDDIVKRPDATLRCIPRHCDLRKSRPHSSVFARLACGLLTMSLRN